MHKSILRPFILSAAFTLLAGAPLHAAEINTTASLADQMPPSSIPAPEPVFTKVIDDLPLMPGLQPMEDEDVLFSAPGAGRIAETNAIGTIDIDDVYNFYKHSLPHLGWKAVDTRTYDRENEQLHIEAHANNKYTIVRFTVKPVGGK